jgi:hypothetical protein
MQFLDGLEDYWERGPGSIVPMLAGYMHALGIYGWDLRDALSKSATTCRAAIETPSDNFLDQVIENNTERAALRVYPSSPESSWPMTLFDVAAALGDDHDDGEDVGIETLIVELGANNALASVIKLDLVWSGALTSLRRAPTLFRLRSTSPPSCRLLLTRSNASELAM